MLLQAWDLFNTGPFSCLVSPPLSGENGHPRAECVCCFSPLCDKAFSKKKVYLCSAFLAPPSGPLCGLWQATLLNSENQKNRNRVASFFPAQHNLGIWGSPCSEPRLTGHQSEPFLSALGLLLPPLSCSGNQGNSENKQLVTPGEGASPRQSYDIS